MNAGIAPELQELMSKRFDEIAQDEARTMLRPMVEKISQQYLLIDRKRAAEMLCISIATFSKLQRLPQIKLVERFLPDCTKILYEQNELRKAVLSITE